ncbi:hypothetical protein B0H12DRAFT_1126049 [Mycena haematopus]|nr:hypothetical protein B0H12DRAFT_1126049 [Mycena haematopus]
MNINVMPPSAASTATLFEFEAGMDRPTSGKHAAQHLPEHAKRAPSARRSSIPGKLQRKISNAVYGTTAKPGSPGLRPLTLLQDRDTNANGGGTPPLSLRKKHNKLRVVNDENAAPLADGGKGRGVPKPLALARTETRQQIVA